VVDGDADKIKQMVQLFRRNAPKDPDGQVLRVADRFGLVAAAGELAIQFGIVPWNSGGAIQAAKACFDAWFADRGGAGAGEEMAAISQVRLFIEKHGEARFEPVGAASNILPIRDRAGWRRGDGDAREWLVLRETWRAEVCAGLNSTAVAKALAGRGMLKPGSDGSNSRPERIQGGQKPIRVYVVTMKIMTEDSKR
jgi:uncharacterized protein (DUF927 family)